MEMKIAKAKKEIKAMKEPKLVKLSAKALKMLRNDPRMQELWVTYLERDLNALEQIAFWQYIEEVQNGTL